MEKIELEKYDGSPANKAFINYDAKHPYWFIYDRKLGGYIMIDGLGKMSTGKAMETERFMKERYNAGGEFYHTLDAYGVPDVVLSVLNVEIPPKQMSGRKSTPATRKIYRKAPVQKPIRR